MCKVTGFKSGTCKHKWLTVNTPCKSGMGFNAATWHHFDTKKSLVPWKFGDINWVAAPAKGCPDCNKKGQYDGNKIRMVMDPYGDPIKFGGSGIDGYGTPPCGYGGPQVVCCALM